MKNSKELSRTFGHNVKKFREKNNLSQEQLAEQIGISVVFLSGLENGHYGTKFDTIFILSKVLNIEPYQLFLK